MRETGTIGPYSTRRERRCAWSRGRACLSTAYPRHHCKATDASSGGLTVKQPTPPEDCSPAKQLAKSRDDEPSPLPSIRSGRRARRGRTRRSRKRGRACLSTECPPKPVHPRTVAFIARHNLAPETRDPKPEGTGACGPLNLFTHA